VTIIPFKDRACDPDVPVDLYLNLHKRADDGTPWYSVRQRGRVIGHCDGLHLSDVEFVVNAKGRDRVRIERRKNVHAWLRGYIEFAPPAREIFDHRAVTYNPYHDDTFKADGEPIHRAAIVEIFGAEIHT
jgi:hypothetical protein